jgi:ribonuclease P protein component
MLPEKFRLKINRKIRAWAGKRELYSPLFKIVYRFGDPKNPPKLGFIVSGKTGRSAERNLVKRRLAEAARQRLEKIPSGAEILIIAAKAAARAKYEEIGACFDKVLPKIRRG